jgi:hypothetical protein
MLVAPDVVVYGTPPRPGPSRLPGGVVLERPWRLASRIAVQPQRLGTGTLQLARLVTVSPELGQAMASPAPPRPLRVGIGSVREGRPRVEVIEVLQVLESTGDAPVRWALELSEASEAPSAEDLYAEQHPGIVPNSLWCTLFPRARFCH